VNHQARYVVKGHLVKQLLPGQTARQRRHTNTHTHQSDCSIWTTDIVDNEYEALY